MDGGICIGRATLCGLGAMGERGVSIVLKLIQNELDLSMAFCGKSRIDTVDREILSLK